MKGAWCGQPTGVRGARRSNENDGTPTARHRYYLCTSRRMRYRWARRRPGSTFPRDCVAATLDADKIEHDIWADIEQFGRDPGPALLELAARLQSETTTAETLRAELPDIQQELDAQQAERDNAVAL